MVRHGCVPEDCFPASNQQGEDNRTIMEINLETLHHFVRHAQEPVTIVDSSHTTRTLQNGGPDVWELAEKADQFWYGHTPYNRAQFAQLMEDTLRPGNVTQTDPPELPSAGHKTV